MWTQNQTNLNVDVGIAAASWRHLVSLGGRFLADSGRTATGAGEAGGEWAQAVELQVGATQRDLTAHARAFTVARLQRLVRFLQITQILATLLAKAAFSTF